MFKRSVRGHALRMLLLGVAGAVLIIGASVLFRGSPHRETAKDSAWLVWGTVFLCCVISDGRDSCCCKRTREANTWLAGEPRRADV